MTVISALADEFFRLAHHDTTGRPLLHPRATGLGLAAALLGELLSERKIFIQEGRLYPWQRTPPTDALAHATLDQLLAQPQHTEVRVWLGFLSTSAYPDVAGRLWRAGHVRPVTERRLLRRDVVTYVPTDLLTAAGPWIHLTSILRWGEPVNWAEGFLLCLARVTGLDAHLLHDLPAEAADHCHRLCAAAPAPISELTTITAAAIGDAVLSYRT
ncbi:MAG: GPP34 family phosphoprotein [Dactylosporangium sp.]|nr:GPP34 family phosphoprotein [Dactylosporangium sp.]NNJ61920.1 GPP34 family phosphoprotein [Dactylosporangium sp.]